MVKDNDRDFKHGHTHILTPVSAMGKNRIFELA